MQRIDENTYIDDTLVTCAEYQLFIDEMREQGKYYQPDHWTSYQFPAGQAREPILGARHSDTVMFCDWLTRRDNGEWKYRLPTKEEAESFSIKAIGKTPLGHWVNENLQFVWIGSSLPSPRSLDFDIDLIISHTLTRVIGANFINEVDAPPDLRLNLERAITRAFHLDIDHTYKLVHAFAEYIFLNSSMFVDHDNHNLYHTLSHIIKIDLDSKQILDIISSTEHIRLQSISFRGTPNWALDLSQELGIHRELTKNRFKELDFARSIGFVFAYILDRTVTRSYNQLQKYMSLDDVFIILNNAYDAYIDLFTLQERIAGRSPAFEGIRLVKERIKIMQRIDENTYIDDTLVTCAEYQLFIDEMREQGKYYQPDHWTSYQFPKGHAHEPILGVRQSDAIAFCEWITLRENGEWKYRLPEQEELTDFSIQFNIQHPLGYWLNGIFQFAWIGPLPKDPRGISMTRAFDRIRDPKGYIIRASDLKSDFDQTFYNALDLDNGLDRKLALTVSIALTQSLHEASYRGLSFGEDDLRYRDLDFNHFDHRNLDFNFDRNHMLDNYINRILDDALKSPPSHGILKIYIDLFTLQERIAGRSPAFEGIRLVKERIR